MTKPQFLGGAAAISNPGFMIQAVAADERVLRNDLSVSVKRFCS